VWWPEEPLSAVLNLMLVFAIVLLHELGHSVAARYFKIRVVDITFWLLGGVARMAEMPENSKVEAVVALAGPLVNFLLAGIGFVVCLVSGVLSFSDVAPHMSTSVAGLALSFFLFNLFMGCTNLLPAFPMDGGRVLRAVLALYTDWVTATRGAVLVGKFFAVLMFVGALVIGFTPLMQTPMGVMLFLSLNGVGLFIWVAGNRELLAVRLRHAKFTPPADGGA